MTTFSFLTIKSKFFLSFMLSSHFISDVTLKRQRPVLKLIMIIGDTSKQLTDVVNPTINLKSRASPHIQVVQFQNFKFILPLLVSLVNDCASVYLINAVLDIQSSCIPILRDITNYFVRGSGFDFVQGFQSRPDAPGQNELISTVRTISSLKVIASHSTGLIWSLSLISLGIKIDATRTWSHQGILLRQHFHTA
jgi:hypothetical protein